MNNTERSCLYSRDRKRLVSVFIFLFVLFAILVARFYYIQVVQGEKWERRANAQHVIHIKEPFHRGVFYSNTSLKKGHPEKEQAFVTDVAKFHLYSDSTSIPPECKADVVRQLCKVMNCDRPKIEKIAGDIYKKSRSRRLFTWLSDQEKEEIEKWWYPYAAKRKIPRNALFFVKDYQRSYPFGKVLGQVLHTVREDRDEETNQNIPTGGLEMLLDSYLQGEEGERILLRSPRHPMDTGKVIKFPQDGADIYLTINHHLQTIAEEEIAKAVKISKAKGGWAVIMDPYTGEIWALAQYPGFDLSDYRKYYNTPELVEHTKVKSITDAHEPGSVMKAFTLAVALKAAQEMKKMGQKPFFEPSQKIDVSNGNFPGRPRPLKDSHSYKYLNMYLAFQKSSNIYMAKLVQNIIRHFGEQWYRDELEKTFGFGVKTGIELPSESAGVLPRIGKTHPNGALEWSLATPYSLAIGHNLMANSIQMLRASAVIANGGYLVKPTIIRKIVRTHSNGHKEVLLDNTTEERRKCFPHVLDPSICHEVIKAMKFVTKPGGTAPRGDINGYSEAGKTGTSEKIIGGVYSKNINYSSFLGFAPAFNPRFIVLVGIDEPESRYIPGFGSMQLGGNCAAPAFKEIAFRTLQYLGVEPDDPFGYPVGDPRRNEEKADWIKELNALKKLNDEWNH